MRRNNIIDIKSTYIYIQINIKKGLDLLFLVKLAKMLEEQVFVVEMRLENWLHETAGFVKPTFKLV